MSDSYEIAEPVSFSYITVIIGDNSLSQIQRTPVTGA